MAGPLSGVRIIDLTMNIMGPLATQILGDMGADIVKVEPPEGDTLRNVGPGRNPGMGPLFMHINRNKRSLAIDLKNAGARSVLQRLLNKADALVYSLRPQAMARLGLDYETVRKINPRLIYCGAFGYGQNGPYAAQPAYDDLIQGAVALPVLQADPDGRPRYVVTAVADRAVGISAAACLAIALFRREKTGVGQSVEVPMFETMAQFVLGDHLYGHTFEPPTAGTGYPRMTDANRRPYRTKDGYVCVLVYTDKHWQRFFELSGNAAMASDPRFKSIRGRTQNIGELYAFLDRTFADRPTGEWLKLLGEADIPAMPLHTPESLLEDPHMQATGFLAEVEHPTEGTIRQIGIPSRWSNDQPEITRQTPRLGEQSVDILADYGFSRKEIAQLIEADIVKDGPADRVAGSNCST